MAGAAAALLVLAAALVAAAAIILAGRRERAARRDLLDGCRGLLEREASSVLPSGYGILRGLYGGRPAALTPIAEALAFRKLPQLWLAAALGDADPDRPSITIVRRPGGTESFVGGADLPHAIRPPESWPQDTMVKTSAGAAALLESVETLLAPALADPKLKAVTFGPRGVRVVRQAAQGSRGAYLLFRDQRFGLEQIPPQEARSALELAAALTRRIGDHERSETRDAA